MSIRKPQFDIWTQQGDITAARKTREAVYAALRPLGDIAPVSADRVEIYLQGSYGNDTNIAGESDVDVVAELRSAFDYDIDGLPFNQIVAFKSAHPYRATYALPQFRADALTLLRRYFGADAITEGNKCIDIAARGDLLPADVVIALTYREYSRFYGYNDEAYVEGITFNTQNPPIRAIVNFPEQHRKNGTAKHQATGQRFKPIVRLFKNARSYLVDQGRLTASAAPSYFVQCLLYNAPDRVFTGTDMEIVGYVLSSLHAAITTDPANMICQNGVVPLFGPTPEQWNTSDAIAFIYAMIGLWQEW